MNLLIIVFTLVSAITCDDGLPVINKCCASNEIVGLRGREPKVCVNRPENPPDLANITKMVGDKEKRFHEIYNIHTEKFLADENFHNRSKNENFFKEYNAHLTEYAILYLEMPNAYNRWIKVDSDHFCIDFYQKKSGELVMTFWIEFSTNSNEPDKNDDVMTAAMLVSCCFLLVVLVVYALLPELRNLCGLILMAYVASLFAALLLLAIIRLRIYSNTVCYRLTLVIYYFFLASFCWMTVMSYDIWWTFRGYAKARPIHRRGEPFKYGMYCIYACGLPLALTIMLAWIDSMNLLDMPWFIKPNLENTCFIAGGEKLLYLYVPMLILICTNWLFYMMTAFNIWRLSRGTAVLDSAAAGTPAAHRTHRHRFLVYLKLSVVMGLNWVLEVISFLAPDFQLWYITDLYNILIGISIFLIFVCKRNILRKLVKVYIYHTSKAKWYPRNSSRSNTTSSDSSQETQTLQVCANPKGPGYVVNNF